MNNVTCECCGQSPIERRDFCHACVSILTTIPAERITEIYDTRSQLTGTITTTEAERRIIISLWNRIPSGESNFMSGFYLFQRFHSRDDTPKVAKRLTRVYANGKTVTEYRSEPQRIEDWKRYNATFRFGTSQFIDGELVHRGYHSVAEAAKLAETEKSQLTAGV